VSLSILTPIGALLAVAGVVPFLALRAGERRAGGVAHRLGLPGAAPSRSAVVGIVTVAALLGLAAAQPVVAVDRASSVRTDAEIYVVLDTSRSMLASSEPDAPTRFDRAKAVAGELRSHVADVPVGVASLTDRVLPHVFPSSDQAVYLATIERSLDVDNPPPDRDWVGRATSFGALSALARGNFFSRAATTRAVVLLSDGETRPYRLDRLAGDLRAARGITVIAVHVSQVGERLYVGDRIDRGYASEAGSIAALQDLASATGGVAVSEDDLDEAARALRAVLGSGAQVTMQPERTIVPLAPWLIAACVLPLGFLVVRRVV
jgi:hypothetical protein